jgi:hypothetical protein
VKRLGVLGTMVWDTIYRRGGDTRPVEEWGGIGYALVALDATLPPGWELVPLIKVGRDLAPAANRFLAELGRRAGAARFIEVPQSNNRVTLRYDAAARRTEQLTGGVPTWTWGELGPMVRDLDALYLNFISGFELTLDTALVLRHGFAGPIYADLHSLFLGLGADGMRIPRALPDRATWFSCFDVVQLNEEEMARLGPDPMTIAADAFAAGVRLLVVTLGARGAIYFAQRPFSLFAPSRTAGGPIETSRVAAPAAAEAVDPTGCGDVFGATLMAQLVGGQDLVEAIRTANSYAARNVTCRGATGFRYHLQGGIAVR